MWNHLFHSWGLDPKKSSSDFHTYPSSIMATAHCIFCTTQLHEPSPSHSIQYDPVLACNCPILLGLNTFLWTSQDLTWGLTLSENSNVITRLKVASVEKICTQSYIPSYQLQIGRPLCCRVLWIHLGSPEVTHALRCWGLRSLSFAFVLCY